MISDVYNMLFEAALNQPNPTAELKIAIDLVKDERDRSRVRSVERRYRRGRRKDDIPRPHLDDSVVPRPSDQD
jgi:hypothetical protein